MPHRPIRPLLSPRAGAVSVSFTPKRLNVTIPAAAPAGVLFVVAVLYFGLLPARGYELPLTLIPVDLQATESEPPPGQVVLHLSERASFLNGVPVPPVALEGPLRASLAGQAEPVVVLDAEDDATFGEIVAMLETIHAAGGHFVALSPSISEFLQGEATRKDSGNPSARTVDDATGKLEEMP